jgi:LemA protein
VNITYIVIIVAFLFLIVPWITVGVRHLKLLRKNVIDSWEFVDEKIRARHDLLPLIVEVIRGSANSGESAFSTSFTKIADRLVQARDQARRVYFASGEKTETEHELSKVVSDLINFGNGLSDVSKDIRFLEFKKELNDFGSDIENRSREYNEVVRKFNTNRNIFILKPITFLLRMNQALIFEFEK